MMRRSDPVVIVADAARTRPLMCIAWVGTSTPTPTLPAAVMSTCCPCKSKPLFGVACSARTLKSSSGVLFKRHGRPRRPKKSPPSPGRRGRRRPGRSRVSELRMLSRTGATPPRRTFCCAAPGDEMFCTLTSPAEMLRAAILVTFASGPSMTPSATARVPRTLRPASTSTPRPDTVSCGLASRSPASPSPWRRQGELHSVGRRLDAYLGGERSAG